MMTPVSHFVSNQKSEATKYFKKLTFNSTYETFHGSIRKEKDMPCEADILKYKRFSELDYIGYLHPLILQYFTTWSRSGEDPKYLCLVIVAVREMYTYIKSLIPNDTMQHQLFFWPKKHQLYI
jgi:hypothetical protein